MFTVSVHFVLCQILVECKFELFLVWFQSMLPVTWDTNSEYIVLFEITNTFTFAGMDMYSSFFFMLQIFYLIFFFTKALNIFLFS